MKCTMGTAPARLTVLPIRTVNLTGQPMANISDHLTMTNLAPFGTCRSLGFPATASATAAAQGVLTPMPCLHNTPFPWMGGKMDYMVQGQPALLKSSKCQCLWGGTISLITDGQIPTGPADLTRKPKTPFNVPTLNLARHQEPAASSETNISPTQGSLYQDSEPPTSSIDSLISKQKQIDIIKAANKGKKGDEINSNSIFSNANLHQNTLLLLKSSEYDPKKKYRVNCSTTSNTFMLRMLGYQVTAKGRGPLSTELLAENPFSLWTNDNQSHVKFFNDGDLLNNWNDNSKYFVRVIILLRLILKVEKSIKHNCINNSFKMHAKKKVII